MSVRLLGLAEGKAAIVKLPDAARQRHGEAVRMTGQQIAQAAKARVRRRFGFLAQQISVSFSPKSLRARVGIVAGAFNLPGSAGISRGQRVARPTKYAHLIEYGHGGPHPAPPFPFMRPSVEAERGAFDARMRAAGKAVERDLSGGRFM